MERIKGKCKDGVGKIRWFAIRSGEDKNTFNVVTTHAGNLVICVFQCGLWTGGY